IWTNARTRAGRNCPRRTGTIGVHVAALRQRLQRRAFALHQNARVDPINETAVNRSEQSACLPDLKSRILRFSESDSPGFREQSGYADLPNPPLRGLVFGCPSLLEPSERSYQRVSRTAWTTVICAFVDSRIRRIRISRDSRFRGTNRPRDSGN